MKRKWDRSPDYDEVQVKGDDVQEFSGVGQGKENNGGKYIIFTGALSRLCATPISRGGGWWWLLHHHQQGEATVYSNTVLVRSKRTEWNGL